MDGWTLLGIGQSSWDLWHIFGKHGYWASASLALRSLCFTEEHLCGINFNLEIADILKWQSIITPTYGSNLALVIAVVSINWGLDWVMVCRADGQWISTTFHSILTQSFHYPVNWYTLSHFFQFFVWISFGDYLFPELDLGSLYSISLLYLKYVSNEITENWYHF